MEQYPTNENAWLFWSCLVLISFLCVLILRYYLLICKSIPVQYEDKNPIKYKIDGVSMTKDLAFKYYYKELDRGRRKNTLHLIIYDSENSRIMFDNQASEYFDKKYEK